jgi:pimeloyl-ACP methyl ester carboxylesterase
MCLMISAVAADVHVRPDNGLCGSPCRQSALRFALHPVADHLAEICRTSLVGRQSVAQTVADPSCLTLEQRMDEVRAVMDAVGTHRAALFGFSEGAALGMLFAASYPSRTNGLILYGGVDQS